MGYISPISFSHYSQYQERMNQPKKVFVPRIDSLKRISKYETPYQSFTDKKNEYMEKAAQTKANIAYQSPSGQFIDKRV